MRTTDSTPGRRFHVICAVRPRIVFRQRSITRLRSGVRGHPQPRVLERFSSHKRGPPRAVPHEVPRGGSGLGASWVMSNPQRESVSSCSMSPKRLEAFSDGVIAIIITIMVLELRPPDGSGFDGLRPLVPKLLAYLLSFVLVAIYWNNHHHLFKLVERIDGAVMWSNMMLLFGLSLVPFATAWFGGNAGALAPVIVYVVVQLFCAASYFVMTRAMLRIHGPESQLALALGRDLKGKVSVAMYLVALPLSFISPWIGIAIIIAVAVMWLIPDNRVVRALKPEQE